MRQSQCHKLLMGGIPTIPNGRCMAVGFSQWWGMAMVYPSEIHDFPGDFFGDFILTHVSAKGCFRGNLSRDFHQFLAEWSQVVQIRDGERMWTQHKQPQGTLDGALLIVWLFFAKIASTQSESLEYPLKRSSPFLNILLTVHWSCKNRETDALMLCYSYSSNTYPQEGAPKN